MFLMFSVRLLYAVWLYLQAYSNKEAQTAEREAEAKQADAIIYSWNLHLSTCYMCFWAPKQIFWS